MVVSLYVLAWACEVAGIVLGATALRRRSAVLGILLGAADDLIRQRQVGRPPTDPTEVQRANTFVDRVIEARRHDRAHARRNLFRDWGAVISLLAAASLALAASLVWYSQP